MNKNLWSLSFILATASGANAVVHTPSSLRRRDVPQLAVFYFFIDVLQWWNGAPFLYPGGAAGGAAG